MQKGQVLIFLLVGILILAAASGAYYLGRSTSPKPSAVPMPATHTPQPTSSPSLTSNPSDETANWKAYTNNKYGYTIRYPQTWQIQEDVPSPYDTNKPRYTFFFVEKQEFLPGIRVYVTATTTPEQWIGRNIQFARSEKIIVADSQAVKLRGIPEGIENEYVFLDKNSRTIVFFASGDEALKVFDQILSTFKFTQ